MSIVKIKIAKCLFTELFPVLAVRNLTEFFASRLHDAMSGAGTNDNQLIRIIVTRAEVCYYQFLPHL